MKYRTTQKAVKNGFHTVIYCGYCDLQDLLYCESPEAYTARREGWGADVYGFGDTAIVTGYAPFGTVRADYKITEKYEKAAREVRGEHWRNGKTWNELKTDLRGLIDKFIAEVTGTEAK